jgi:hypothetical protein
MQIIPDANRATGDITMLGLPKLKNTDQMSCNLKRFQMMGKKNDEASQTEDFMSYLAYLIPPPTLRPYGPECGSKEWTVSS